MLNVYKRKFQKINCPRPPGIYNMDQKLSLCNQVEVVPEEVSELGWELVHLNNTISFTNKKYKTKQGILKHFKPGVKNTVDFKNEIHIKNLYPIVDPRYDIYEIGFSFLDNVPVSNKFTDFWDTRRGKRYSKYIQYRKYRDMVKEQHTSKDGVYTGNHDPEFEKYLVARKEKERKRREEKEQEELEKSLFESDYESDDPSWDR